MIYWKSLKLPKSTLKTIDYLVLKEGYLSSYGSRDIEFANYHFYYVFWGAPLAYRSRCAAAAKSPGSSNPVQLPLQVKEREQGWGSDVRAMVGGGEKGKKWDGDEWKERKERDKKSRGQGDFAGFPGVIPTP